MSEIAPRSPAPQLYRSRDERLLMGVCGGLAEHHKVDVAVVRGVFLALMFVGGLGAALYLLMVLFVARTPLALSAAPQRAAFQPTNPARATAADTVRVRQMDRADRVIAARSAG